MLRIVLTICLALCLFSVCAAQNADNNSGNKGKVIFKAKTEFPVQLQTELDIGKNKIGDDANFILTEEVSGEGEKLEKGSELYGRIVGIEKISAKNTTSKVCILFDFIKKGEQFLSLNANIILIEGSVEDIKLAASTNVSGGTDLSLKSKDIQVSKGKIFRVRLMKDITVQ